MEKLGSLASERAVSMIAIHAHGGLAVVVQPPVVDEADIVEVLPAALVAIDAAAGYTLALRQDGTVLVWGTSSVVSELPPGLQ